MSAAESILRRPAVRRAAAGAAMLAAWAAAPASAPAQVFDKLLEAGEKAAEVAGKAGAVLPIGAEEETAIGRGVAATLAGYYTLDRDSALTAYVNLVGLAVAASDPRPDVRYRFGVLGTDQVNAMATPGGYVFVTRGALALMESEAELAGVLAHEVGHVNEKHVVEEIQDRARTELGTELAGKALNADPEALDKVVGLGTNVLFLGLSREDELEADSLGVVYASRAGYDPAGLGAFVRKLEANESRPLLKQLGATHPKPADRLKLIDRVAGKAAGGPAAPVLAERFRASVPASR
ncbi:MAG TPA: M48 family metalloprotease [Gemmatimonadota bacterium]